eukprot:4224284-Amphidinium_carterae.1
MGRGPRISILPDAERTATQKLLVRKQQRPASSTDPPTPECTTTPYCASGRPVWTCSRSTRRMRQPNTFWATS